MSLGMIWSSVAIILGVVLLIFGIWPRSSPSASLSGICWALVGFFFFLVGWASAECCLLSFRDCQVLSRTDDDHVMVNTRHGPVLRGIVSQRNCLDAGMKAGFYLDGRGFVYEIKALELSVVSSEVGQLVSDMSGTYHKIYATPPKLPYSDSTGMSLGHWVWQVIGPTMDQGRWRWRPGQHCTVTSNAAGCESRPAVFSCSKTGSGEKYCYIRRMKFTVITIFPQLIEDYFKEGILSRALKKKQVQLKTISPRKFAKDRHQTVDDMPYGGGRDW